MRAYVLAFSVLSTLFLFVSAEPAAVAERSRNLAARAAIGGGGGGGGGERVAIPFGRQPIGDSYVPNAEVRRNAAGVGAGSNRRSPSDSTGTKEPQDGAANYLITLERTATNDVKDKILDVLLRSGAVVKQTYDYRVFKGVLFTVPRNNDKGLTSWQQSLEKQEGVKYVEEDSVVRTQ